MLEPRLAARVARAFVRSVGFVGALALGLSPAGAATPDEILADLHPDYSRFVHSIRVVSFHAASVSPAGIYSGLVRPGGRDPRILDDTPVPGQRNDVILYPDAIDPSRGPAWLRLILDHEYFHAIHLAGAAGVPRVDFGQEAANKAYYEAVAWSYVLERARGGVYGAMGPADLREVTSTAKRHHDAFRAYVEKVQPSAWLHYGRFLGDPGAPDVRASLALDSATSSDPSLAAPSESGPPPSLEQP